MLSFFFSLKFLVGLVGGFFIGYKLHNPIVSFATEQYTKIKEWWQKRKENKN